MSFDLLKHRIRECKASLLFKGSIWNQTRKLRNNDLLLPEFRETGEPVETERMVSLGYDFSSTGCK